MSGAAPANLAIPVPPLHGDITLASSSMDWTTLFCIALGGKDNLSEPDAH